VDHKLEDIEKHNSVSWCIWIAVYLQLISSYLVAMRQLATVQILK